MEKIEIMEMKIINDKKILKEEKKKNKVLNQQILELQTKSWNDSDNRENKIKSCEKQMELIAEELRLEKDKGIYKKNGHDF